MTVQASDIVLLPFPFTDLSARKLRPVLVLRDPDARGDFLAIQVTSKAGHPGALELIPAHFALNPLDKTSYVRPDKLFTLNTAEVVRRDSRLQPEAFEQFKAAVCRHIGCRI